MSDTPTTPETKGADTDEQVVSGTGADTPLEELAATEANATATDTDATTTTEPQDATHIEGEDVQPGEG